MAHFDVFNGDADGLCALHQLRLAAPCAATLVTGVKRDIALLGRVDAQAGDSVTVLDVSIDANRKALLSLLERGVSVQYADHHGCGGIPVHPGLQALIDTAPDVCTGSIVDRWLGGRYRVWAVVAAFGDNLAQAAVELAQPLALQATQIGRLQELGECLNYNAYGEREADLMIHPAALYAILHRHADPFTFIDTEPVFQLLRKARGQDLELALHIRPYASCPDGEIVILPDTAWSRRVRGAYGNALATRHPHRAHAILTPDAHGDYTVSVRAPLATMRGADRLCRLFPGGGGRPAAGGINPLPRHELSAFIQAFGHAWQARRDLDP